MSIQDTLDYLDEKAKILNWLIEGYGITGLPLSAINYLTKERICVLYNTELEFFKTEKI